MSSAHFSSASRVVTFSSEPIAERWETFVNPAAGGAPTLCVGESGVTRSGDWSSRAFSSSNKASYALSGISGSSSTW
jgi:hypothetical protein